MLNAIAHGRIGRDTEVRYTPDSTAVAEIAIACNYGRKGQDGRKPTQWLRASLWGKQAEALAPYLTKGKGVCVIVSDLHVREFKKQDGTTSSALEGRVDQIEFTGAGPRDDAPAQAPAATPRPQRTAAPAPATSFSDMDDDIPFVLSLNDYSVASPKSRRLGRTQF